MPFKKYKFLLFCICFLIIQNSAAQILCVEQIPSSTNTAYLHFEEGALIIDDSTYFGDDIFINTLYKDKELGMICSGIIQYDKGLPITMSMTGKDVFVNRGFSIGDGVFLVLQREDGCILDSLQIILSGEDETLDSLIFQPNSVLRISSIKAKTGDCLLTSTKELPNLISINIFPNPAYQEANIQLSFAQLTELELNLFNANGQLLFKEQLIGTQINHQIQTDNYPAGIYFLQVNTAKGSGSHRIIVMK